MVREDDTVPDNDSRRFRRFWRRHRTAFWTLHSIWALAAGVAVLVLAHERYGFVPWVVLFLLLTWATTLLFSRSIVENDPAGTPGLRQEVVSYLTRIMYQETLFFILPFYWYSTVIDSSNVVFSIVLGALAVLSCIDLLFDRWLRTYPLFGLVFFSTVAFAAVNLVFPLLLDFDPVLATPLAAVVALGSAVPIAIRGASTGLWNRIGIGVLAFLFLALVVGIPGVVPPVPLRIRSATFAANIDRTTLTPLGALESPARPEELDGALFVVVEVFAPSNLGTTVRLDWSHDGELVRTSREITIVAHELGFRVWDAYRPQIGRVGPGRYRVILRTSGNRVFGVADIQVTSAAQGQR